MRPDISCEFTWNIKPYFLRKIKVKKTKRRLLQFLSGALRVKAIGLNFKEDQFYHGFQCGSEHKRALQDIFNTTRLKNVLFDWVDKQQKHSAFLNAFTYFFI